MKKGDLARCSQGYLGLITSDEQKEVFYPDGSKGMAWIGIHVSKDRLGEPWSSRKPIKVHNLGDILSLAGIQDSCDFYSFCPQF